MTEKTSKLLNVFSLVLPLSLFILFAAISCGDDNGDGSRDGDGPRVGIAYSQDPEEDLSFNYSAYQGIKRAQQELGAVVSEETANLTEDNNNSEEIIRSLAGENDLVIAVGFEFGPSITKVADENPDTNFAIVDIPQEENTPTNVASLLFNPAEGSFLVGAIAALKSETDSVGFIGGVCATPDKIIEPFEAGFVAGVSAVAQLTDRNIEVKTQYLSQFPDVTGWANPDKAMEISEEMFEADSDIIFGAAGGVSAVGLFEAAAEFSLREGNSKVWAIGVDSDQYLTADESVREHILTSMLKRVDIAVYDVIKTQKDDEFSGGETIYDLADGGVGYASSGGFTDDVGELVEGFETFIVSDRLRVPIEPDKGCGEPQTYNLP